MQTGTATQKHPCGERRAAVGELSYSAGETAPSLMAPESFSTSDTANTRVSQPVFVRATEEREKERKKLLAGSSTTLNLVKIFARVLTHNVLQMSAGDSLEQHFVTFRTGVA